MSYTMRDITEYKEGEIDLEYLQKKISCAGEMKTAIKRFLNEWQTIGATLAVSLGHNDAERVASRIKTLQEAMEDYLNCEQGN